MPAWIPILSPCPPILPIFGNLLSFPTHHPWYNEFMEKNSSIVSDRPHSYLGHEVYGGKSLGLVHCGSYMRSWNLTYYHKGTSGGVWDVVWGNSLGPYGQVCRGHLEIQQAEATQCMNFWSGQNVLLNSQQRSAKSVHKLLGSTSKYDTGSWLFPFE